MFVTKEDLKKLGFGNYQSYSLIKQAKALMVQKGFAYYNSKGLGRVPLETVEEILGVEIDENSFSLRMDEDELKDFCKKLSRVEFEDSEKNKSISIKAMGVVLLALGYDESFVEEEFKKEIEKTINVKENGK